MPCRELYAGKPPFTCNKLVDEDGVWGGKYRYARDMTFPDLPPSTPPGYLKLMLACLSYNPKARPTFKDILVDLTWAKCMLV